VLTKDDYLECLHRTKEVSQGAGASSGRLICLVALERIDLVSVARGYPT
jgi:hypothetical protein